MNKFSRAGRYTGCGRSFSHGMRGSYYPAFRNYGWANLGLLGSAPKPRFLRVCDFPRRRENSIYQLASLIGGSAAILSAPSIASLNAVIEA
jgi:hypothetical protein